MTRRIAVEGFQPGGVELLGQQPGTAFFRDFAGQTTLAHADGTGDGQIPRGLVQVLQKPRDGPARARMKHFRGNLGCRFENKPPPCHPRMGNDQIGGSQCQIVVKQQVEVDGPRPPVFDALPAQIGFGLLQLGQQGLGGQRSLQNRGGIQIGRLRAGPAHGKGLVVLALPRHFDVRMPLQSDQGLIEQSAPIAQVRT